MNVFTELEKEIEKSEYMLKYEDGFDDEEDSIGYSDGITRNKAIEYLRILFEECYLLNNIIIVTPHIWHGPDGSIDVCWNYAKRSENNYKWVLLLNIPKNENVFPYYGKNYLENKEVNSLDRDLLIEFLCYNSKNYA